MGINSYQAPQPAIAGIAAALNAVQNYYGIDTQKAQQKLLGVQTDEAQSKAKLAQLDLADQEAMAKGQTPIRQKLKNGAITLSDTPAPTATADTAPAPAKSPVAANDAVASDAVSPLKQSFQKISDVSPSSDASQSASPLRQAIAGQKIKDAYGNSHIVLNATAPDGSQIQYYDPKQEAAALETQQKQADLKKTGVETAKASEELKELPQTQKTAALSKFTDESKTVRESLQNLKTIQTFLLSGNKSAERLGQARLAMEALGVKRASNGALDLASAPDSLSRVANYVEKSASGHLDADELDNVNKAVNAQIAAQNTNLKQIADTHDAANSEILKTKPGELTSKLFLPKGSGVHPVPTGVGLDPETGERVLFDLSSKKPRQITKDQPGPQFTSGQKAAIATGSALTDFIGGIGHKIMSIGGE